MSHISKSAAVHCINPDCQRPYPQPWDNKFCNSCGAVLHLLDRYVPMQRLGAGGFAQIYTVWDERTQTEKVLKVLVEDSPKALELFAQEAEVLVSLRHPGVPKVEADAHFQVNLSNPKPRQLACLVMEKINGPTLADMLNKFPQGCPPELVLSWLTQALKILQELHKRQIIHRDIKPSNLMLRTPLSTVLPAHGGSGWEQLVLIDFGGAKQVKSTKLHQQSSSTRLFSSGYSPPEQVRGGKVGPEADFYALGRTMIELLTGRYPSDLEDPNTGVLQWRNQVNVNRKLADLLDEMVLEDPRSRPANAAIIQKRLAKIIQPSPQANRLQQLFIQAQQKFYTWRRDTKQALKQLAKTVRKIFLWLVKAIWRILKACLLTIWAVLLTGLGAGAGTIGGFVLAYRTNTGDRFVDFISTQLSQLLSQSPLIISAESIVFAAAGLGTAWGITASGCFGQRRQFLTASLMGIISYIISWILWQVITSNNYEGESLVGGTAIAAFLLALSIGFRSHQIVYSVFGAVSAAMGCTAMLIIGFSPNVLLFGPRPFWLELSLPIAFFSSVGICTSLGFGVTYYLIVPTLRWIGWR